MDLQGSLVDTNLRIIPSNYLTDFLKSLSINDNVPVNIIKLVKGQEYESKQPVNLEDSKTISIHLNNKDIENINKIKALYVIEDSEEVEYDTNVSEADAQISTNKEDKNNSLIESSLVSSNKCNELSRNPKNDETKNIEEDINVKTKKSKEECNEKVKAECSKEEMHLLTSDIDWLYAYLQKLRSKGDKNVPYLHKLLEGAEFKMPPNEVIKRNPVLEARCVKLRAQQEAREYRKMTKSVDNVRMRFPEDNINFQLKQVNRHLIAIGQFILSIFAGFLFGFKGVEWMVGPLDFGFKLLLGVMCALIIALAEIYFLAKKLNEELNIPETVQLGGPPKFVNQEKYYDDNIKHKAITKEHID